jgi:YHS domain-containing protein
VSTACAHPSQSATLARVGGEDPTIILAEAQVKKGAVKFKRNVDANGVILKGYDPVAYITQGKAVKGNPSFSSTYHGAIYHFASKADKADFDQSPGKFEPQYGAFCAGSLLRNQLHDVDPNVFYVYKGRLYLCRTAEMGKIFMAHPDQNVQKANKNWEFYEPPRSPGFHEDIG